MSPRLARRLVRLYPRTWRARYEEEFVALVEASSLTPGLIVDLLLGVLRERARLALRFDPEPVSIAREAWRDGTLSVAWIGGIGLLSWVVGRLLARAGYQWTVAQNMLFLWPLFALPLIRAAVVFLYRFGAWYRATLRLTHGVPEASLKVGLSSMEFYAWMIGVTAVATLAQTSMSPQPAWALSQVAAAVALLRSATRRELARRDLVERLYKTKVVGP